MFELHICDIHKDTYMSHILYILFFVDWAELESGFESVLDEEILFILSVVPLLNYHLSTLGDCLLVGFNVLLMLLARNCARF